MKKQFLKAGAVITAFSLAAGLPGINTVLASEATVKTYRYEGVNYFYTLNEDEEIVWTTNLPEEGVILVPPFVKKDSDPLKEIDLPKQEAEPTVTLIVTEITPETIVFSEDAPVPEAVRENEIPAETTAPDIDPTVIPTEEELQAGMPEETAPVEEAAEAPAEETAETEEAEKEIAAEAEEEVSGEAEAEDTAVTEEVKPEVKEETAAAEEVRPEVKEETAAAEEVKPELKEETAAAEEVKPELTETPTAVLEPAKEEIAADAEKIETKAAGTEKTGEPAAENKEEAPADEKTEEPAEKPAIPAATEEKAETAPAGEAVTPAAEEAPAVTEALEEEPEKTPEVEEPVEEENPLLALGKQERLKKYENLCSGTIAAEPAEEIVEEEEPAEEIVEEKEPAEEIVEEEEPAEEIAEETVEAGETVTEEAEGELIAEPEAVEPVGESEDALAALARQQAETEEEEEEDVTKLPYATETWTPGESVQSVIPDAVETTLEDLEKPADVTSVDETVANAAPGTKQIVGDTDKAGSKTITAAPTATPTATPVPATETAVPTSAASGNAGSASSSEGTSAGTAGTSQAADEKRANPKTGDTTTPLKYVMAMIASGAAFFTAKRKKRV